MSTPDATSAAAPDAGSDAAPQGSGQGLIRSPRRLRVRLLAIVLGTVAAVVVWVVAVPIAGYTITAAAPGAEAEEIVLGMIAVAALSQSAVGWALLALLERFLTRARTVWLVLAALVLVGTGVNAGVNAGDLASGVILNVLHVAVAAFVVPMLARTSPRR